MNLQLQPGRPDIETRCIEACLACHAHCLETSVVYCLKQGGAHAQQEHIRLMLDCAAICRDTADFGLRASPYFKSVCALCARVCDDCAESCRALGDTRKGCADMCAQCAELCRQHGGT